tara:strand:- start:10293 stop:11852 length:1560 start_codon:yes stop_codon:yes gene_type:complete
MSYISLHTNDKQARFTNNFNEDLIIKKNSKIALVNIKFEAIEDVFNTTTLSTYPTITYSLYTGMSKTVNIGSVKFDNTNYDQFYVLLTTLLNNTLTLENKMINSQWKVSISDDAEVVLEWKMGSNGYKPKVADTEEDGDEDDFKLVNISKTVTNNEIRIRKQDSGSTANLNTDTRNQFFSGHEMIKGAGYFRCQIGDFDCAQQDTGFIIGVTRRDPISWETPYFDKKHYTLAINLPNNGSVYKTIHTDTINNTGKSPANVSAFASNNDIVEIRIEEGNLKAVLYQDGQVPHIFKVLNLKNDLGILDTHSTILYPFIFIGNAGCVLENIRCSFDPFKYKKTLSIQDDSTTYASTTNVIIPSIYNDAVSQGTVEFNVISEEQDNNILTSLRRFMGFQRTLNKKTGVDEIDFFGDIQQRPTFYSSMYYIEITNLVLDSFISIEKGKKSVLLPLPIFNKFENHFITYEPNNLYFVNLLNTSDIALRNFSFRIVDKDYNPVSVNGRSDLTFVVEPQNSDDKYLK